MRRYIVATHARLSEGILSALDMIVGRQKPISAYCAYVEDHVFFKDELEKEIAGYPLTDEILIFTDLYGGSVNNELLPFINLPNVYLISGVNLIVIISMLIASEEEPIEEMIERTIREAQSGMIYCRKEGQEEAPAALDEF